MMALHGIEIEWLRPQCLPVNLQSHGLVWKAVSRAMSLAEFSVQRREPLDAEYWDKLALALWFKTWKHLAEFQITSSHFLLYLFSGSGFEVGLWPCREAQSRFRWDPINQSADSAFFSRQDESSLRMLCHMLSCHFIVRIHLWDLWSFRLCSWTLPFMNGSGTTGSELEEWSWSLLKKKRSKASGDKTLARVVRLMGEFDKTSYEDIDQKMRDEIEHADEVPKDIVTRKRQPKVNKTPARFRAAFLTMRVKCFVLSHM